MAKTPLISILIVNYNGLNLLEECLDSLLAQSFSEFEIVLVDNGSKDGSAEFIEKQYPKVKLVRSRDNKGFAGGNNLGVPHCQGDFIYFLNNDTRCDPDALSALSEAIKKHATTNIFASFLIN